MTMLASINTASLLLVGQAVIYNKPIGYKLAVDLNRLSKSVRGYNCIPVEVERVFLRMGRVNGE